MFWTLIAEVEFDSWPTTKKEELRIESPALHLFGFVSFHFSGTRMNNMTLQCSENTCGWLRYPKYNLCGSVQKNKTKDPSGKSDS